MKKEQLRRPSPMTEKKLIRFRCRLAKILDRQPPTNSLLLAVKRLSGTTSGRQSWEERTNEQLKSDKSMMNWWKIQLSWKRDAQLWRRKSRREIMRFCALELSTRADRTWRSWRCSISRKPQKKLSRNCRTKSTSWTGKITDCKLRSTFSSKTKPLWTIWTSRKRKLTNSHSKTRLWERISANWLLCSRTTKKCNLSTSRKRVSEKRLKGGFKRKLIVALPNVRKKNRKRLKREPKLRHWEQPSTQINLFWASEFKNWRPFWRTEIAS